MDFTHGPPYTGTIIDMTLRSKSTFLMPRMSPNETGPLVGDIIERLNRASLAFKTGGIFVVYGRHGDALDPRATVIIAKGERIQVGWFPSGTPQSTLDAVRELPFDMDLFHSQRMGESYTVAQLKQFCKDRNLKVGGTKPDLIRRLTDYEML